RVVPRVGVVTGRGWVDGAGSRGKVGLMFGGVSRVVTTLGIFGFDPETRRMRVEALHHEVALETVRANTGFELLTADPVAITAPPTPDELQMLRALDPDRRFLS